MPSKSLAAGFHYKDVRLLALEDHFRLHQLPRSIQTQLVVSIAI